MSPTDADINDLPVPTWAQRPAPESELSCWRTCPAAWARGGGSAPACECCVEPRHCLVCCWMLVTWGGMYWYPWFVKTNTPVFFAFSTWAFRRTDAALPISGPRHNRSPTRGTSSRKCFVVNRLETAGGAGRGCSLSVSLSALNCCRFLDRWHDHNIHIFHNNTCLCCRRWYPILTLQDLENLGELLLLYRWITMHRKQIYLPIIYLKIILSYKF